MCFVSTIGHATYRGSAMNVDDVLCASIYGLDRGNQQPCSCEARKFSASAIVEDSLHAMMQSQSITSLFANDFVEQKVKLTSRRCMMEAAGFDTSCLPMPGVKEPLLYSTRDILPHWLPHWDNKPGASANRCDYK